jgi:glycosyltransferase involved in cell wall biosynthesis
VHVVQHLKSGGAETLVRALVRGLARENIDVRVVSIYADGLNERERAELGVPVRSAYRRGRGDLAFLPRLVRILRDEAPDIVHAHLSAGKYAGRFAALLAGVPAIVFTEHGDERRDAPYLLASRALHARTVRFVVFSDEQRRALAAADGVPLERIRVVPNGVAPPPPGDRHALRASIELHDDAFALYVPARLVPQKNQALAIDALARTSSPGDGRVLVLAGAGPDEASLRARARAAGIEDRVRFLGFRDDAATLMRAMDAFVMPSVWERMPLALGEAMLAGLPVVSTPWTGSRAFLEDGVTAFVSADASAGAFARALSRLSDPVARAAVASRGEAFASERFDLATTVRGHVALYDEVARVPR